MPNDLFCLEVSGLATGSPKRKSTGETVQYIPQVYVLFTEHLTVFDGSVKGKSFIEIRNTRISMFSFYYNRF